MTQLARALIEIRVLRQRVEALEARLAARAPKRMAAPRPTDNVIDARQRLWARLVILHAQHGAGRLTKLRFAVKHHLGDPSDFRRFFSAAGRGIPEGSMPAVRYYEALREALAELEARRGAQGRHSHGIQAGSPSFSLRPQ